MSDSFERMDTTRTQTINVSGEKVLIGFQQAIEQAIEAAETALAYSHALGDSNVETAEGLFEQLSTIALNGLGQCTRRRIEIGEASEPMMPHSHESTGEVGGSTSASMDDSCSDRSPLLLTLDESAQFLGISRDQLVVLMDSSEFAADFEGSELRLNMRDLDEYLQRNGAGRSPTPLVGTVIPGPAMLKGLGDLEEDDFESIFSRLFENE